MTITRVIDESGQVVHDCERDGCDVSWDGVALRDLEPADMHADEKTRPKDLAAVKKGAKVPNANGPDLGVYDVKGATARVRRGY